VRVRKGLKWRYWNVLFPRPGYLFVKLLHPKGLDYSVESEGEDFNAYEYVACKQVKNNNKNNNNGNNVKYYAWVEPYMQVLCVKKIGNVY